MTFHFAGAAADVLTHAALDPVAKIPAFKACAVELVDDAETTEPLGRRPVSGEAPQAS